MEPERRKLFKKKIKNCLEPETPEKVKRKKTVEQNKNQGDCTSLRPKTSLKNMPKTVTYLGSHSYMEQNKDLIVLQPLEGEKLSHNEENTLQTKDEDQLQNENAPLDIIANMTYKTPEKSPQAKKDNEVLNIKTPYKITKAELKENIRTEMNERITSQVCQIEIELEEENTEDNDDEIIDVFDTANPLIDKTAKKTDNENLLETEKVHCQQEITATDNEKLKIDRTQNKEDTENLSRNEEVYCRQEITASDTENLNIDRKQNKEDTENLSKTEVVRCQQEEKLHSEPSQEKEREREKDDFLENREHLTPSIMEIIPEKDMNIIRKSLEEENAQDNDLPSFPDNEEPQPKKQKRKQSVMLKSYVDFLSDEEDFVWDSSSWKETGDESSSESELSNPTKRQKKNKKRSQETTVGEGKKRMNKRKLNNQLKKSGQQYTKKDGSIVQEKRVHENPCAGKKCGNNCAEISEERRKGLFDHFWTLSAERKKDWLVDSYTIVIKTLVVTLVSCKLLLFLGDCHYYNKKTYL